MQEPTEKPKRKKPVNFKPRMRGGIHLSPECLAWGNRNGWSGIVKEAARLKAAYLVSKNDFIMNMPHDKLVESRKKIADRLARYDAALNMPRVIPERKEAILPGTEHAGSPDPND